MPAPTPTDVILVARGEPADQSPEQLGRIREAVTDANVLLVAPALPVAQIIDRPAEAERIATPDRLMRLIERYGRMPVPVATGR